MNVAHLLQARGGGRERDQSKVDGKFPSAHDFEISHLVHGPFPVIHHATFRYPVFVTHAAEWSSREVAFRRFTGEVYWLARHGGALWQWQWEIERKGKREQD